MGDLGSEHGFLLLLFPVHLADGILLCSSRSGTTYLPISRRLFHQGDLKTGGLGEINKCRPTMPSPCLNKGSSSVSVCPHANRSLGLRDTSFPMFHADEAGLRLCALLSVVPGVLWWPQHRVLQSAKAPDFLSEPAAWGHKTS